MLAVSEEATIMAFRINNQFENLTVSHTIRFPEKLHEELSALAAKQHISFNKLVLQCCRYAVDDLEKDGDNPS